MVTALREAQADLEASHAALQQLIAQQDRVQEEERSRIARELHDDLQQTQAAIRMDISELGLHVEASSAESRALLSELDSLAAQAIMSTRRIVDDLRPRMLEELGLVPALQALASQFAQRTAIDCEVAAPDDLGEAMAARLELATCLYRVAQEALNNVFKHAQASHVDIRLARHTPNRLALRVLDNGIGIAEQRRSRMDSFGILGMRERVRAQGGSLVISRVAAGGTLLEALLPLDGDRAIRANGAHALQPLPEVASGVVDPAPLPRLLGRTARQALQGVIDALDGPVAVLDGLGVVRHVNRAWIEFAVQNGNPGPEAVGPGANLSRSLPGQCAAGPRPVLPILHGLGDLLEGRTKQFSRDYDCHTPTMRQWFRMHAAPMSNGDVLISHFLTRAEEWPDSERAH